MDGRIRPWGCPGTFSPTRFVPCVPIDWTRRFPCGHHLLRGRGLEFAVLAELMTTGLPLTQIVACGLVIVHRDNRRFRFLALRRFSDWDFVVGEFDGAADPQQVAIDAAREFTGIDDLTFPWGDDHRDTLPVEDNQVSRYYLGQTETKDLVLQVPIGLGSEEDYEYRWVTAEEAEDTLPPRLAIVLEWALNQLAAGIPAQNR